MSLQQSNPDIYSDNIFSKKGVIIEIKDATEDFPELMNDNEISFLKSLIDDGGLSLQDPRHNRPLYCKR